MLKKNSSYKYSLIFSLLLHIAIFFFLFINFSLKSHSDLSNSTKTIETKKNVEIIHAVAVSQKQVQEQIKNIKEEAQQRELEKQREIRKAKLAKEKIIKERKIRLEKERRAKLAKEREKLKKAVAQKLKKEQEKKRKLKEAQIKKQKRLEKQKALAKEKELLKRKEDLEKRTRTLQKSMQSQIAQESKDMSHQLKEMQNEIDKYKTLIIQSISSYWIEPPNLQKNIYCKLLLHLAPGGKVLKVDVIRQSANPAMDRSAINAIWKASPLPVPNNTELFNSFRLISITVRPEGVS